MSDTERISDLTILDRWNALPESAKDPLSEESVRIFRQYLTNQEMEQIQGDWRGSSDLFAIFQQRGYVETLESQPDDYSPNLRRASKNGIIISMKLWNYLGAINFEESIAAAKKKGQPEAVELLARWKLESTQAM